MKNTIHNQTHAVNKTRFANIKVGVPFTSTSFFYEPDSIAVKVGDNAYFNFRTNEIVPAYPFTSFENLQYVSLVIHSTPIKEF